MIVIKVYGLDQYVVGHYSHNHSANLAQLFETKPEEIVFVANAEFLFHKGVEQTSWQTLVRVEAPEKYKVFEDKVSKYLLSTFVDFAIHVRVLFDYFAPQHEHVYINKDHPRYLTDDNLVNVEESDESEEELYEGNIFEGMEKKLEEAYSEKYHHCHEDGCDCGDDCDCDGECDCDDEECECHHLH